MAGPAVTRPPAVRSTFILAVAAVVVIIDQLTKVWVVAALDHRVDSVVWKLQLRVVRNPGMAFSVGRGVGPVLGVVSAIVVVILIRFVRTPRTMVSAFALALILGGAIGNLIDRLVRAPHGVLTGRVVDFIDFQFWPVFNVADIGVSIGVILILLEYSVRPPDDPAAPPLPSVPHGAPRNGDPVDDRRL